MTGRQPACLCFRQQNLISKRPLVERELFLAPIFGGSADGSPQLVSGGVQQRCDDEFSPSERPGSVHSSCA